jgi:hypothetical protein
MLYLGYLVSAGRISMKQLRQRKRKRKERLHCIALYFIVQYLTELKVEVGIYINGVISGQCKCG